MNEMCLDMSALGMCVVKLVFLPLCTAFVPYCFTVQPLVTLTGEEGPDSR